MLENIRLYVYIVPSFEIIAVWVLGFCHYSLTVCIVPDYYFLKISNIINYELLVYRAPHWYIVYPILLGNYGYMLIDILDFSIPPFSIQDPSNS